MKFFGVPVLLLETESFLGASDSQIAEWLRLHALCCKQTNGGRVEAAAGLPPKFWDRHGIDPEVVHAASPLWRWDGDDLVLDHYDHDGERIYLQKVKGGKSRAKKMWEGHVPRTPTRTPIRTPDRSADRPDPTLPEQTESLALNGTSPASSPSKMSWSMADGFSGITPADREAWAEAFPAVNIDRQLAAAGEWLKSNPAKARKSNWRKFITGWLSKAQDRGGDIPSNRPPRRAELSAAEVGL